MYLVPYHSIILLASITDESIQELLIGSLKENSLCVEGWTYREGNTTLELVIEVFAID
jgi:hypothetical protein